MTFEIPDELLLKITKRLQEIGKTPNQLKWFECLNGLLNEQMKK